MKPTFTELKDLIRNPRQKYFLPEKVPEKSPRTLVNEWLDSIGASEEEKAEVIEQCENDMGARSYYLAKARGEK